MLDRHPNPGTWQENLWWTSGGEEVKFQLGQRRSSMDSSGFQWIQRSEWLTHPNGNIPQVLTFESFASYVAATVLLVLRNAPSMNGVTSHDRHQLCRRGSHCKNNIQFLYMIFIMKYLWKYLSKCLSPRNRECGLCKCRLAGNLGARRRHFGEEHFGERQHFSVAK